MHMVVSMLPIHQPTLVAHIHPPSWLLIDCIPRVICRMIRTGLFELSIAPKFLLPIPWLGISFMDTTITLERPRVEVRIFCTWYMSHFRLTCRDEAIWRRMIRCSNCFDPGLRFDLLSEPSGRANCRLGHTSGNSDPCGAVTRKEFFGREQVVPRFAKIRQVSWEHGDQITRKTR